MGRLPAQRRQAVSNPPWAGDHQFGHVASMQQHAELQVRQLNGQRYTVQLPGNATVGELKAALAAQHGLTSCRLNLRVSERQKRWLRRCLRHRRHSQTCRFSAMPSVANPLPSLPRAPSSTTPPLS